MSVTVYIVSAVLVFVFSGFMAMAGLGAAFLFVPLFYYLGLPLAEAVPAALLLNVVSLMFATFNYWRGGLINWRIGLPISLLLLAILALPLARSAPRSSHYGRMLIAVLGYMLYFNLLALGRGWIATGQLPEALGLWWLHAAVLLIAIGLMVASERHRQPKALA